MLEPFEIHAPNFGFARAVEEGEGSSRGGGEMDGGGRKLVGGEDEASARLGSSSSTHPFGGDESLRGCGKEWNVREGGRSCR